MKYIDQLLNSDEFDVKQISRMRSRIDGSLVEFSRDEILTQLISHLVEAKNGHLCTDPENNILMCAFDY